MNKQENIKAPPTISIILPINSYNQELFRESMKSLLHQFYKDFEIIIVDGSKFSSEILKYLQEIPDKRILYYRLKTSKETALINHGLKKAKGDYIILSKIYLCFYTVAFAKLKYILDENIESDFVYGNYEVKKLNKLAKTQKFDSMIPFDFLLSYQNIKLMIFRKRILDKIGYFNESLKLCSQNEFIIRIMNYNNKFINIKEVLCYVHYLKINYDALFKEYNTFLKNSLGTKSIFDPLNYFMSTQNCKYDSKDLSIAYYKMAMIIYNCQHHQIKELFINNLEDYFLESLKYNENFYPSLVNLTIILKNKKKDYLNYLEKINKIKYKNIFNLDKHKDSSLVNFNIDDENFIKKETELLNKYNIKSISDTSIGYKVIKPKIEPVLKNDKIPEKIEIKITTKTIEKNKLLEEIDEKILFDDSNVQTQKFIFDGYQICISKELEFLRDLLMKKYKFINYISNNLPTVFFGVLNKDQLKMVETHSGEKIVLLIGEEFNLDLFEKINSMNISKYLVLSKKLYNFLKKFNVFLLDLNLSDNIKLKNNHMNKIIINTGFKSEFNFHNNSEIIKKLIKEMSDFEFVITDELNTNNINFSELYSDCFISINFSKIESSIFSKDLEYLKIPSINNYCKNCLKWKDIDDIKYHIMSNYKSQSFYTFNLNEESLSYINKNIDYFVKSLDKFKNILLISSDYPGYGGAATNCQKIQELLDKFNHKTYAIYYNFNGDSHQKIEVNEKYKIILQENLQQEIKKIPFIPDLIILKNYTNLNLKEIYNCPVYFLVPGLFLNELNKYYYDLNDADIDKYINKNIIKQINNSDKIFCNSNHTKELIKKIYNIDCFLFYSSFIPYYEKKIILPIEFSKRKYNYGLIVSNFDRKIKNVEESINFLKDKKNIILIGTNSSKYSKYGFDCLEFVDNKRMNDFYNNIKYIIQDSFFESCSNVSIEALFNGCIIEKSKNLENKIYKEEYKIELSETNEISELQSNEIFKYQKILIIDIEENNKIYENYYDKNYKIILLGQNNRLINKENIFYVDYTKKIFLEIVLDKIIQNNYLDLLLVTKDTIKKYPDIVRLQNIFRSVKLLTSIKNLNKIKKIKFFINFKPKNIAYGGGNQFAQNIIKYLSNLKEIEITYELDKDIDIYFLIDIRKDRNGEFKRFTFDEIYASKNPNSKIIYRINDCDITREKKELEKLIVNNIDCIDYFVFNSHFIKNYYFDKYPEFKNKQNSVIYNTVDSSIFYPKKYFKNKKIKIVTHHWSDNINKGYDYYYKLSKFCENSDKFEFIFIGRKFNDNFTDPPLIVGPYKEYDLAEYLRSCDIYITASIYDACPMHVLEGLSCGLPMLYLDHEGGVKNICEMNKNKVGESFEDFDTLLEALNRIINNYDYYCQNVKKNIKLYNSKECYDKYLNLFYTL